MKTAMGYFLALVPALGAFAVVLTYCFFVPLSPTPPDNTHRGTETVVPLFFGLLFAIACLVRRPGGPRHRQTPGIRAGVVVSPTFVLLFYLWIVLPSRST